jgi:hypothetical protein
LARRSSSLRSSTAGASSTTTGISPWPALIQCASRLKPSKTSKAPSSRAATRRGISAKTGAPCGGGTAVERNGARFVRRASTGSQRNDGRAGTNPGALTCDRGE